MRSRPLFWLGAALLLAALGWGVERLIVTDREAIGALVERAGETASEADWLRLRALLAPDFRDADDRDRNETVQWLEDRVRRHRPTAIEAVALDVEVDGDQATGRVRIGFHALGRPFRLDVPATFVRDVDGWLIASSAKPSWVRPGM